MVYIECVRCQILKQQRYNVLYEFIKFSIYKLIYFTFVGATIFSRPGDESHLTLKSCEIHVHFCWCEFHVNFSREIYMKTVHVKFIWNSHDLTYVKLKWTNVKLMWNSFFSREIFTWFHSHKVHMIYLTWISHDLTHMKFIWSDWG